MKLWTYPNVSMVLKMVRIERKENQIKAGTIMKEINIMREIKTLRINTMKMIEMAKIIEIIYTNKLAPPRKIKMINTKKRKNMTKVRKFIKKIFN